MFEFLGSDISIVYDLICQVCGSGLERRVLYVTDCFKPMTDRTASSLSSASVCMDCLYLSVLHCKSLSQSSSDEICYTN